MAKPAKGRKSFAMVKYDSRGKLDTDGGRGA
jgi:hypothetical protein